MSSPSFETPSPATTPTEDRDESAREELFDLDQLLQGLSGHVPLVQENKMSAVPPSGGGWFARPCWGSLLTGKECTTDFVSGTSRFKYQFCPRCQRDGIRLSPTAACMLPPELASVYQNPTSHGMWATKSVAGHIVEYRVINHTSKCRGGAMLILREPKCASFLGLPAVPVRLVDHVTGDLRLTLSRGTLVPATPAEQTLLAKRSFPAPSSPNAEPVADPPMPSLVVPLSATSKETGASSPAAASCAPAAPAPAAPASTALATDDPPSPTNTTCDDPEPAAKCRRVLLSLTTMHAQLGTQLQAFLEEAKSLQLDGEANEDLLEYRSALERAITPLIDASEVLSRLQKARECFVSDSEAEQVLPSLPARTLSSFDSLP